MSRSAAATDALLAEILVNIDSKQHRASEAVRTLAPTLKPAGHRKKKSCHGHYVGSFGTGYGHRPFCRISHGGAYQALLPGRLRAPGSTDAPGPATFHWEPEFEQVQRPPDMPRGCSFDLDFHTVLVAGLVSPNWVIPKKPKEMRVLAEKLKRGLCPNDVVVEQGIALFRLAKLLNRSDFDDLRGLAERIERRDMPVQFLGRLGLVLRALRLPRSAGDLDVASPRYGDDPVLALRQMSSHGR